MSDPSPTSSLVRQIAQRHGGMAACVSTTAGVTTLLVELPAGG
ncbi:MAG: hypothetical protein ACYC8V_08620 [Caulobacteraceae bacterium]